MQHWTFKNKGLALDAAKVARVYGKQAKVINTVEGYLVITM